MTQTLRLGTRGSQLAVTQSQWVADRITSTTGVAVELVTITTKGDVVRDRPLAQVGGKGLFTKEIEDALLDGRVDLAVHSMKDMPTDMPEGLIFGAVPEREDPRDAVVGSLHEGAVVGTGSARRKAQLAALRPDLDIQGIRGNVDTRIRKTSEGYDAVVLALAGLNRLGRGGEVSRVFGIDELVPAVGQGALAVQCREDDAVTRELLDQINDADTSLCVSVERAFLMAIAGGCSVPAACHCIKQDALLVAHGMWAEGDEVRTVTRTGDLLHGTALGRAVAEAVR